MQKITIALERPALDILRDGKSERWEYDVLTVKLEMDRLAEQHHLDPKRPTPTAGYLSDLAAVLDGQGLTGCTVDLAMRMHSLVTVQFAQLATSISQQVAELDS